MKSGKRKRFAWRERKKRRLMSSIDLNRIPLIAKKLNTSLHPSWYDNYEWLIYDTDLGFSFVIARSNFFLSFKIKCWKIVDFSISFVANHVSFISHRYFFLASNRRMIYKQHMFSCEFIQINSTRIYFWKEIDKSANKLQAMERIKAFFVRKYHFGCSLQQSNVRACVCECVTCKIYSFTIYATVTRSLSVCVYLSVFFGLLLYFLYQIYRVHATKQILPLHNAHLCNRL